MAFSIFGPSLFIIGRKSVKMNPVCLLTEELLNEVSVIHPREKKKRRKKNNRRGIGKSVLLEYMKVSLGYT